MAREWVAQPKQSLFLYDYGDLDEIFYGGAAGGGKSDTLCIYQGMRRMAFPGSAGLMLRRRFTDLNQPGALIPRFREIFHGAIEWNENKHEATWPNGSVTKFGYIASDADVEQYQGASFDDICWDEVTQFTEYMYTYMYSRARVRKQELADMGCRRQIRCAGNPGGVGHAYFRRRFVKACRLEPIEDPEFTVELPDGTTYHPTRVFIPSFVDENTALMKSDPFYKMGLQMLPEKTRRMLLEGDWDGFDGQYFTEWREWAHVVPPQIPPAHWRRWIGFDWGFAAPWVALWLAQDPDTRQVWCYRELKGTRMNDSEIARAILEASSGEYISAMYCDPSIWAKKNDVSTADVIAGYRGWNIDLQPANNDRIDGWRRVREYLGWEPDGMGGVAVSPMLVIGSNCRYLIDSLPDLQHDEIKVEDLDTDGDDHAADALRYGLVSRPIRSLGGIGRTSIVLLPR
jgi:hypothetical protein